MHSGFYKISRNYIIYNYNICTACVKIVARVNEVLLRIVLKNKFNKLNNNKLLLIEIYIFH